MSFITTAEIPGLAEAQEREQMLRDLAMDGQDIPLCGRIVRQFTLRLWLRLAGCDNAFIVGGLADMRHVAMFLWFLSREYSLLEPAREAFYKEAFRTLTLEKAKPEIDQYLTDALWDYDRPAGSGQGMQKSYYSFAASKVERIARHFGWDDDAILDKPVARILQYERVIVERAGLPLSNRTDAFIGRWLAQRNGAN